MIDNQLHSNHPKFSPLVRQTVWDQWHQEIIHEYKVTEDTFHITSNNYYIVLEEASLLAFASIDLCDLSSLYPYYTPWLADLYVFPAYRDKNVATNFLHFISTKHPILYLWCETALAPFYTERGWTRLHETNYLDRTINILSKISKWRSCSWIWTVS